MIFNKVSNPFKQYWLSGKKNPRVTLILIIIKTEQDLKHSIKNKETHIKQNLFPFIKLSYLVILTINTTQGQSGIIFQIVLNTTSLKFIA
jgi:hypothetical protein